MAIEKVLATLPSLFEISKFLGSWNPPLFPLSQCDSFEFCHRVGAPKILISVVQSSPSPPPSHTPLIPLVWPSELVSRGYELEAGPWESLFKSSVINYSNVIHSIQYWKIIYSQVQRIEKEVKKQPLVIMNILIPILFQNPCLVDERYRKKNLSASNLVLIRTWRLRSYLRTNEASWPITNKKAGTRLVARFSTFSSLVLPLQGGVSSHKNKPLLTVPPLEFSSSNRPVWFFFLLYVFLVSWLLMLFEPRCDQILERFGTACYQILKLFPGEDVNRHWDKQAPNSDGISLASQVGLPSTDLSLLWPKISLVNLETPRQNDAQRGARTHDH